MTSTSRTVLLAVALAGTACGSGASDSSANVSPVVLPGIPVSLTEIRVNPPPAPGLSTFSGYITPQRLVIRSSEAWPAAWATIWANHDPVPPLPDVDFTHETVLVAATGTLKSGGYTLAMPNASLDGTMVRVGVVEVAPGTGCVVAAAEQRLAYAVRMARVDGEAVFVDRRDTTSCPR